MLDHRHAAFGIAGTPPQPQADHHSARQASRQALLRGEQGQLDLAQLLDALLQLAGITGQAAHLPGQLIADEPEDDSCDQDRERPAADHHPPHAENSTSRRRPPGPPPPRPGSTAPTTRAPAPRPGPRSRAPAPGPTPGPRPAG